MSRDGEAYMPPDLIKRVLESATADVILIGGQALAYWMGYYGIGHPASMGPAVSRDVDFFTSNAANSGPLTRFAKAIGGRPVVLDHSAISALIGSAVAPAEEGRVYNVDLLHQVVGLQRERIESNAVEVPMAGSKTVLRVMHPLDVLQSRNANLHSLAEKQDSVGQGQLRLAIDVAREYLAERIDAIEQDGSATGATGDRMVLDAIRTVSEYSTEDAARKNAERYGIFLADAIPAWRIASGAFWKHQWPRLRERMSPAFARQCEEKSEIKVQ